MAVRSMPIQRPCKSTYTRYAASPCTVLLVLIQGTAKKEALPQPPPHELALLLSQLLPFLLPSNQSRLNQVAQLLQLVLCSSIFVLLAALHQGPQIVLQLLMAKGAHDRVGYEETAQLCSDRTCTINIYSDGSAYNYAVFQFSIEISASGSHEMGWDTDG